MMNEKDLGADAAAVVTARSASVSDAAPHAAPEIVTVELDPEIWYRGRGAANSRLLRDDGAQRRQCCLGVACSARGVSDAEIRNRAYPTALRHVTDDYVIQALVEADDAEKLGEVYVANDHDSMPDGVRVALINAGLTRANVPLRFTLKSEGRS